MCTTVGFLESIVKVTLVSTFMLFWNLEHPIQNVRFSTLVIHVSTANSEAQ